MRQFLHAAIAAEKKDNPAILPHCLGALALPEAVSRCHIFVAGTTGTGKSVCLNKYLLGLDSVKAASPDVNKAVIYHVKGEFNAKHFQDGDIIFYPFDRRSIAWSFFNESQITPTSTSFAPRSTRLPKTAKTYTGTTPPEISFAPACSSCCARPRPPTATSGSSFPSPCSKSVMRLIPCQCARSGRSSTSIKLTRTRPPR